MLYILSGDRQSGKTRWLCEKLKNLRIEGTEVVGVLAPGIWEETQSEGSAKSFQKLGISNILLPQNKTIQFATLNPNYNDSNVVQEENSDKMLNKWQFSEEAIKIVNTHFDELAKNRDKTSKQEVLLVIDEIGPLELKFNKGLISAVKLLELGQSTPMKNALVVFRPSIIDMAVERFAKPWGGYEIVKWQKI